MTNSPKILFLLVNYFNEKDLHAFVNEQLKPKTNKFIDVVITDNGSAQTSLLHEMENKHENVTVLKSNNNLGYFGAANLGLIYYLNQYKDYPQVVIVCNTDILLHQDFFSVLENKLVLQNFDILGPSIYSTFLKYDQNPYILKRISKNKLKFLYFITSNYFFYTLFTMYHILKTKIKGVTINKINTPIKTYAIHGSFIVFNKTFFEKGGTINYPSILFGEEIFIAEQALKLNLNLIYDPALQVEHNEHATTGVFKSKQTISFLHQSYSYLLKAFFIKSK